MCDRRRFLIVSALSVALLAVIAGGVAGLDLDTGPESEPVGLLQEDIDADTVSLKADIDAAGDADWQIVYRLELDDESDVAAFDELQDDINENRSAYLDPFEQRIHNTARTAENATDREMSVENFDIASVRRDQPQGQFGVVTYSFEWNGFAAVDEGTIEAGDALDQMFMDENERLQFGWPQSHELTGSSPTPETVEPQRVIWRGPIDFDGGQPRITLDESTGDESTTSMRWLVGAGILAIIAGTGLLYWWTQRRERAGSAEPEEPAVTSSTSESETDASDSQSTTDATESGPPIELLSNEEQILRLLDENGGRMKQKEAADELEWSAAKTSQVVGDLREADKVESFRLGRENVLTLPEVDLEDTSSEEETDTTDDEGR